MRRCFFLLLLAPPLIFLFILIINMPDQGEIPGPAGRFDRESSAPTAMPGDDNGFFLLWTFAEAPGVDFRSAETRQRIAEMADPEIAEGDYRRNYYQWSSEHRDVYNQYWKYFNFYFPRKPDEDPCGYFSGRRMEILNLKTKYGLLLKRYGLLLRSGIIGDFTLPGRDFPLNNLVLINNTCRLFLADKLLGAMEGRWRETVEEIAQNIELGLRIIGGSRIYPVHQLGKNMVDLSLRSLCSLMNRNDFPRELYSRLLERLPVLSSAAFGTLPVIEFEFRNFSLAVERMKRESRIDPYMLKDYFRNSVGFFTVERLINSGQWQAGKIINPVLSLFLKKKETLDLYASFWNRIRWLEAHPPYQWPPGQSDGRFDPTARPLWWLRNAFGKMMVRSAIPFPWVAINNHVYRTHLLKARYDLTRILAEWHSRRQPGEDPLAVLREVEAFRDPDPFSGKPYRVNPEKMVIYSIGSDREDNGGTEQVNYLRDSDITVPYFFGPPG